MKMIIINILVLLCVILYGVANILVAHLYDVELMKEEFIEDQHLLGRICANAFYAPAWMFKGIKFLANKWIA
jgi:hypothetical protein